MRDKLAAMQARRGHRFFASPHRAIRHVMHAVQMLNQWKTVCPCDRT
jgi:hypothetical protein